MTEDEALRLLTLALTSILHHDVALPAEQSGQLSLRDLGVSSLRVFEFVSVLERLGHFVFDDYDVNSENFDTVGSVLSTLARYELGSPTAGADGQSDA